MSINHEISLALFLLTFPFFRTASTGAYVVEKKIVCLYLDREIRNRAGHENKEIFYVLKVVRE